MKGTTTSEVNGVSKTITQAQHIKSSIQQVVTITQIGQLGTELGLDETFTNIIGLSFAAIQGQTIEIPQGELFDLATAFSNIRPMLFSSLAQFGVTELGEMAGLDPQVANLIGTPIGAIAGGIGFDKAKTFGENTITAIGNGILRGATSLGVEYLTQEAGLDPLLGSLTSRAITGAIEGMFKVRTPNLNFDSSKPVNELTNPAEIVRSNNIFEGIFNAFADSALNVARLGISGTDSWSQAQYFQRVTNFSNIIQRDGLAQAIEDSAAQILHEDAVSSILRTLNPITTRFFNSISEFMGFLTQGNTFENPTRDGSMGLVTINGVDYRKISLPNGDYQIYSEDGKTLVEVKRGDQILKGTFGKATTGEWGLSKGVIEKYQYGRLVARSLVENGNLVEVQIGFENESVLPKFIITKLDEQNKLEMKDGYEVITGKMMDTASGTVYEFKNGFLVRNGIENVSFDLNLNSGLEELIDPLRNNLQNAEAFIDKYYDDVSLNISGAGIFGSSTFEYLNASLRANAGFTIRYGDSDELKSLVNSMLEPEYEEFIDYARLKFDDVLNFRNAYSLPSEEELLAWEALKINNHSEHHFMVAAIHGTTAHKEDWAAHLNGVEVKGEIADVYGPSWNLPGTEDELTNGLWEYWSDAEKRQSIDAKVKRTILEAWENSNETGIPFDIVAHSLGNIPAYVAIRELSQDNPNFRVRNFYMIGSPLRLFLDNQKIIYDADALNSVSNTVNLYNANDMVLNVPQRVLIQQYLMSGPLGKFFMATQVNVPRAFEKPVSGAIRDLFTNVKDVKIDSSIQHTEMLKKIEMLKYIEEYGEV